MTKHHKMELSKAYEPSAVEESIYEFWLKNKYFFSTPDSRKPFTIVIPPPNVTGSLHMGHALNNTLQDAIIRYKKLCGLNTCWVPGTDHGGIATQNVVEKILLSEGKNKNGLGREKFLERMWLWKNDSGGQILNQLKKLGCALDWDRTRFTMDEICSRAVQEAFVRLYEKKLIYRGKRLVNWCPRCMTALSDIEVEHEEEIGKLWYIKYPLSAAMKQVMDEAMEEKSLRLNRSIAESLNRYIVVATTRPETMLGDTAVAVHPDDERYKYLIGEKIILPLIEREIPVLSDFAVEPTFGSGAVKVTPAHDPADFEIGLRHNLEKVVVIDYNGKMTSVAGKYAGLDRYHARKEILKDLEEKGLLLKTVDHPHAVGICYRCSTVIEPLISEQWFLNVKEMSQNAVRASRDGKLKFYPSVWESQYINWLENLKDWCISRQIWWGHRIPVYYCKREVDGTQLIARSKNQEPSTANCQLSTANQLPVTNHQPLKMCPPIVSADRPSKCPHCGGSELKQDEDVLDTWFSSALWPFSVFGWPKTEVNSKQQIVNSEKPESNTRESDLLYYYPTSVLVTGHEILYLWVARMVQFGLEFMQAVPFGEVYIHGIVRDKFGKKMSKSLGNVIDPLNIMKKYGTDALRFAMISSATAGRDMQLSDDSFIGARNFTNKLYNAARFILMNLEKHSVTDLTIDEEKLEKTDRWVIHEINCLVLATGKHYETYELDKSARLAYDCTWSKFCDWYIEFSKERLYGGGEESCKTVLKVLVTSLIDILKVLHPIMPFITEDIWQNLKSRLPAGCLPESIMISEYPKKRVFDAYYAVDSGNINAVVELISKIRAVREEMGVPASKRVYLNIKAAERVKADLIIPNLMYIKNLAKVEDIHDLPAAPSECAYGVVSDIEFFIPLKGLIDIEKEKERLDGELEKLEKFQLTLQAKLKNENFIKKAPPSEVENTKNKSKEAEGKIEKLRQNRKYLGG